MNNKFKFKLALVPRPLIPVKKFNHKSINVSNASQSLTESATKVINNMWLGDYYDAHKVDFLTRNGIKFVLNISHECMPDKELYEKLGIQVMHVLQEDRDADKLKPHMDAMLEFIHNALVSELPIIVHCRMGVSRSATVVIAYLIKYGLDINVVKPMLYTDAFMHVKNIRPYINPNFDFVLMLREMDPTMKDVFSDLFDKSNK